MAEAASPSDQNLDLLLAETPWGRGGVARLIRSAPDPDKMRAFWSGLAVYRYAGMDWQHRYDQALSAAQGRNAWEPHLRAVAMTKLAMLASPGDYPFCLTGTEWRQQCQSLYGGQIDSTLYKPPSAAADTARLVAKTLFGSVAGVVIAGLLPEDLLVGSAIAGLAGPAAVKGVAMAAANTMLDAALPTGNPIDDMEKAAIWQRYQIEYRRRKLA